ncbi:FUSC family protein [Rahnella contaminans]|uniref:FUSC family protein n=1 Tax=Rahnella contaminans TaxID=2703882 RepID=UPI0023DC2995|nr:FUSC family protein [Rahnella contaminans]MDF1897197.1 FUSC family protein [Rahnella contaminans]
MNVWPRPFFSTGEMIYSLKTFIAAMLALYLSSLAGLPNTFWSLITVYVVSQPWAGMVRSKAVYRITGTFIGSSVAIFLLPPLVQSPELLSAALALWVGLCVFISQLDRTPRSYIFMLAGYTAAFIAFPGVAKPQTIFETAVTRVEEIFIGIMCATLVHSVILPAGLTVPILGSLDKCLNNSLNWMRAIFVNAPHIPQTTRSEPISLSMDIVQLRLLSTHIPFDTTNLKWTAMAVQAMQNHIAGLLPLLSATEDRIQALRNDVGEFPDDVAKMMTLLQQWLAGLSQELTSSLKSQTTIPTSSPLLLQTMHCLTIPHTPAPDEMWLTAVRISLLEHLARLDRQWQQCITLRNEILKGFQGGKAPRYREAATRSFHLHQDKGVAMLSAITAVVAVAISCFIWIMTGWPDGATAAMMAAVFCSFFASMDKPAPHITGFIKYTAWSFPFAVLYIVGLLPLVNDFAMFVLISAPFFLITGCYTARPATVAQALPFLFGVAGTLLLHDYGTATLPIVINTFVAQLIGTWIAAAVNQLMRTLSSEWSVNRIRRSVRKELAVLTTSTRIHQRAFMVRAVDRTGLIAARLAQYDERNRAETAEQALRDLRIGANIITLRQAENHHSVASVSALLSALKAHFLDDVYGGSTPSENLRRFTDTSLMALFQLSPETEQWQARISAIVGVRHNLFPDAGPELLTNGE